MSLPTARATAVLARLDQYRRRRATEQATRDFLDQKGAGGREGYAAESSARKQSTLSSVSLNFGAPQTGNYRRDDCVASFGQINLPTIPANRVNFDLDQTKSRFVLVTL